MTLDALAHHGKTIIIIAHHMSTVKNANTIAVIKQGQVVKMGTHKELFQASGFYNQCRTRHKNMPQSEHAFVSCLQCLLPVSVSLDKFDELLYRLFFGNVLLDAFLLLVKTDFAASGTHVTIVGIGHLARSVDDAAHDAYLQSFQVRRSGLDAGDGTLQIVERASAAGTGDVFRLAGTQTAGL